MKPQCNAILEYIRINGFITGMQSVKDLGILNYKARVNELREAGWPIVTTMVTKVDENGDRTRFAVYSMGGPF